MKEIDDFVAKADRFLGSARMLFEHGDYDSCASRCYYAMFFMAQAALFSKGITARTHRGVINLFGQHFTKTGIFERHLARAFSEAYDYRLTGDYDIGTEVTREQAQRLLTLAEDFLRQVRTHLQKPSGESSP